MNKFTFFFFLSASLWLTLSLFQLGDGQASDVTVLEYKPRQQLAVNFSEELKAGQYCVLTMEYSANFSNAYDGFYKSFYIDKDGNKRYPLLIGCLLAGYLPQAFKVAVIKALLKKFLFVPAVVTNYRLFLIFLLVQRILKD